MEVALLFYIIPIYLILVLGVVLAASRRRITLFKAFIISFLLTPVTGIIALSRASRKVLVTHYNPLCGLTNCPYLGDKKSEVCEQCDLIGKFQEKLSIKKRYFV